MNTGPGVNGHYALDAKTFADWNVDYVKVDGCYTKNINLNKAYPAFGKALNKTGRPMVYSCSWPFYQQNVRFLSSFAMNFSLNFTSTLAKLRAY